MAKARALLDKAATAATRFDSSASSSVSGREVFAPLENEDEDEEELSMLMIVVGMGSASIVVVDLVNFPEKVRSEDWCFRRGTPRNCVDGCIVLGLVVG